MSTWGRGRGGARRFEVLADEDLDVVSGGATTHSQWTPTSHNYGTFNELPPGTTEEQAREILHGFNAPTHETNAGRPNDPTATSGQVAMQNGFPGGHVFLERTENSTTNRTSDAHPLIGQVHRELEYNAETNTYGIRTTGTGEGSPAWTNPIGDLPIIGPGLQAGATAGIHALNAEQGPPLFNHLDRQGYNYALDRFGPQNLERLTSQVNLNNDVQASYNAHNPFTSPSATQGTDPWANVPIPGQTPSPGQEPNHTPTPGTGTEPTPGTGTEPTPGTGTEPTPGAQPQTQTFDDGSTLTTNADGTMTSTPSTDNGAQPQTQTFDDGSTLTTNADGTMTSTPSTDSNGGAGDQQQLQDGTDPLPDDQREGSTTSTPDDGSTTQTFDDGSSLTTNADGSFSSTDSTDGGQNQSNIDNRAGESSENFQGNDYTDGSAGNDQTNANYQDAQPNAGYDDGSNFGANQGYGSGGANYIENNNQLSDNNSNYNESNNQLSDNNSNYNESNNQLSDNNSNYNESNNQVSDNNSGYSGGNDQGSDNNSNYSEDNSYQASDNNSGYEGGGYEGGGGDGGGGDGGGE